MVCPILRARLAEAYGSWPKEPGCNSIDDSYLWCAHTFEGTEVEQGLREMNPEYVIGGIIVLLMLIYLMYALLKPERF